MQDQTIIHDPKLRRLARDFDALADILRTLIDKDRHASTRSAAAQNETEFTTEWQMGSTGEEVRQV
jgi:hypothetical protein